MVYSPVLRGLEKRPGEVALVFVPAKHTEDSETLIVSNPAKADREHEWPVPQSMKLAAFVYGPAGLNKKKVKVFLAQDDQLVAQLADYAEKTSETEALLQTLADNAASSATMNSALSGFASQYGLAVQLDKTAPPAVQAQMLFTTMNPQLATYNPISSSSNAQALGETASVATAAATLFFGSPVGLAAGGTAMLLELRAIAFPGLQFRSSFAQTAPKGMHLCGQRGAIPPHTRIAYIWATRVPDRGSPEIRMGAANSLPLGQKADVPVEASPADWKYVQRVRKWTVDDEHGQRAEIKVLKVGNEHTLQVDLEKTALKPGDYQLSGDWDWTPFQTKGVLHLRPLSDFKKTQLDPASQNLLLAHTGKIPVTLRGDDFEFTSKVEMERVGDEFATPETVRFLLPKGPRLGPQDSMDVQIDTASLTPGPYKLLITQQDGKSHAVAVRVLDPTPQVQNLPVLLNQGVNAQHYLLKGQRLDLLGSLTAKGATFDLGQTEAGGTERELTINLNQSLPPGTSIPVDATLTDRAETMRLPDALEITGPLPAIASAQLSLPKDLGVAVAGNEFPAGYTLTALLDVRNISGASQVHLACADDPSQQANLRVGAQDKVSNLEQVSPDQLFLSYDTSAFPAGCKLMATIENGRAGMSQPFALARLIRLPHIESVTPTTTPTTPAGLRTYEITGENLEMIGQLSFDQSLGVEVNALPAAVPGEGQRQSLTVNLPVAPSPSAPLYLWLRGETTARATTALVPNVATPVNAPARASAVSPAVH